VKADDLYAQVTNDLVAQIEAGASEWQMPWHSWSGQVSTVNRPYRGINAAWLAMVAADRGYAGRWGTYKAWKTVGAQVLKGERATRAFLWRPFERENRDTGEVTKGVFATTYAVFAAEQCSGVPEHLSAPPERVIGGAESVPELDRYFAAVGADVRHGGDRACYRPGEDRICLPYREQFVATDGYYSTVAHEHVHWTGAATRLNRDLSGRFGSDAYAVEELTAELGAAFFAAHHHVAPDTRSDNAAYLASWLRVLRADPKVLRTVAGAANKAITYMDSLAGVGAADLAA
jgi:antirestriction protein ArdC